MKIKIEDEKKFLVKRIPIRYLYLAGKEITQWYVWFKPPVRVRVENFDDCYLTIKIKRMPGVRLEIEKGIGSKFTDRLARFRKFNKVRKTRRNIKNLELDVFYVQLHDLVLLEFEKKTGKEILEIPSDILVEEVTGDERFENHNLAKLDRIPEEWRCKIIEEVF